MGNPEIQNALVSKRICNILNTYIPVLCLMTILNLLANMFWILESDMTSRENDS